jgi:hypothetical protein
MCSFVSKLLRSCGFSLVVIGLFLCSAELRADDPGDIPLPLNCPGGGAPICNFGCTGFPCPSMTTCKGGGRAACTGCICSDRDSIGACTCIHFLA